MSLRRRKIVQFVPCPYCLAGLGQPCRGARGHERLSCHVERWEKYREVWGKS